MPAFRACPLFFFACKVPLVCRIALGLFLVCRIALGLFLVCRIALGLLRKIADVKAAFLQSDLSERIYLRAPPGYESKTEKVKKKF